MAIPQMLSRPATTRLPPAAAQFNLLSSRDIMRKSILFASVVSLLVSFSAFAQTAAPTAKPKLTLDEFFDSVGFTAVKVSPDGDAVVVATEKAEAWCS
jgi:hypothetical protein